MEFIQFFVLHGDEVLRLTGEHLVLVGLSTGGAVLIGIPLGVGLARNPRWRRPVLGLVNAIQTIPSLARFAILIPLPVIGGIGAGTAAIALVLYSRLPVVSNTVAGLTGIDPAVKEAAGVMGMTNQQLLWRVELPLALGVILFFFSSRRRHTISDRDWSSDVCSSDLFLSQTTARQWRSERRISPGTVLNFICAI